MTQPGAEKHQIERASRGLGWQALVAFVVLAATIACIVAMEMMGGLGRITGPTLSIVWCLGFALWSLRSIRSHRSKFGMRTVLCITAILAVGLSSLTGRFIVLAMVGLAMVLDLFVKRNRNNTRLYYLSRTIQALAGVTFMAHASRVIYHIVLKQKWNYLSLERNSENQEIAQDLQHDPLPKAINRTLMLWLFGPGLPYLANKLLLRNRIGFVSESNHAIVFGILAITWCVFALLWIGWILRSSETWWIKLCIILPLVAVFRAVTTLNFQAATGILVDVGFPQFWNYANHLEPLIRFQEAFGSFDISELEKLSFEQRLEMVKKSQEIQTASGARTSRR